MLPDILLVRLPDGYRILHGHLHLTSSIAENSETFAHASGEGKVKVVKTADGVFVRSADRRIPLVWKQ